MLTKKNQAGFSLIEVFVSIAILAVVVFSFYKLPVFFAKSEKSVSSVVTKDRLFKGFSQQFIEVAERADVATRFQNLPISTSCVKNKPCVRKLEEKNKAFVFSDMSLDSLTSVQFLRDEAGELETRDANMGGEIKVQARKPTVFERSLLEGEYYATWPLVDASSQPFVLMRRGEVADHFFMEDAFMTSDPTKSRWMVVKGTRAGIDLTKLVGHPMLIYNVEDLSQYTAQKVEEAIDCQKSPAFQSTCQAEASKLNPLFNVDSTTFGVAGSADKKNQTFPNMPFYLVRLEPFRESDLRFTNGAQSNGMLSNQRNFLPDSGMAPTPWHDQDPSFYLFPTEVASMFGGNFTDLQKPVDGKRLGHFIHMMPADQQGKLALLPFDIVSYQMEDLYVPGPGGGKIKDPAKRKNLTLHTLGSNSSVVALADIGEGDQIIFARRLGRAELSVYHLK